MARKAGPAADPVIYGRHKIYPDYAAQPYIEYRDNNQYFHCVYCVGQGAYPGGEWFTNEVPA